MIKNLIRLLKLGSFPSYVVFFVTAQCNANCKMCFYKDNMMSRKSGKKEIELSLEEYAMIAQKMETINILGISGGEPFMRSDLSDIIKIIYRHASPLVVDLPTNGYFVKNILAQVEEIAKSCPTMIVDVQLSIDGPEKIHNEIRGVKNGYQKVRETYRGLLELKKRYSNLKVKACVVYSHYNQHHIEELFHILQSEFSSLDRIVFSVVHGSVSNKEAFDFNWERYFDICESLRRSRIVDKLFDFHSIFTIALRVVKNVYLKDVLLKKDMYKRCGAGQKVIAIGETGNVYPCEPLWESVGNLRNCGYDIKKIVQSDSMKSFIENIHTNKCTCHWGLPMSNTLIFSPRYYPRIILEMIRIFIRSLLTKKRDR